MNENPGSFEQFLPQTDDGLPYAGTAVAETQIDPALAHTDLKIGTRVDLSDANRSGETEVNEPDTAGLHAVTVEPKPVPDSKHQVAELIVEGLDPKTTSDGWVIKFNDIK